MSCFSAHESYSWIISFIATVCTSTSRGTLLTLTGLNPSTWTLYSYTYVASRTTPTLTFAFQVDGTREYHLDGVSVISVTPLSSQLLTNPSFENSTSTPAGWTVGCESTCGAAAAHVLSGANCYLSSGLCFSDVGYVRLQIGVFCETIRPQTEPANLVDGAK